MSKHWNWLCCLSQRLHIKDLKRSGKPSLMDAPSSWLFSIRWCDLQLTTNAIQRQMFKSIKIVICTAINVYRFVCVAMAIAYEINIIIYHNINEKYLLTQYWLFFLSTAPSSNWHFNLYVNNNTRRTTIKSKL